MVSTASIKQNMKSNFFFSFFDFISSSWNCVPIVALNANSDFLFNELNIRINIDEMFRFFKLVLLCGEIIPLDNTIFRPRKLYAVHNCLLPLKLLLIRVMSC